MVGAPAREGPSHPDRCGPNPHGAIFSLGIEFGVSGGKCIEVFGHAADFVFGVSVAFPLGLFPGGGGVLVDGRIVWFLVLGRFSTGLVGTPGDVGVMFGHPMVLLSQAGG